MKKEHVVQWPHYKVLVKGTMTEYTPRFKDAEEAFKFSDGERQMFEINQDGSAKLIKFETGRVAVKV